MKTKEQINNDINILIRFIKKNEQSLNNINDLFSYPSFTREIQAMKNNFYTIVDNLTSEFTEQELYTIKTNLLLNYQTLKELIDVLDYKFRYQSLTLAVNMFPETLYYDVTSFIIKQEDISQYTIYIQRCIDDIKKQKMQLRHITETYTLYTELAGNLDQQMMAMDEQLYNRQTQRHEAIIKNTILDGV